MKLYGGRDWGDAYGTGNKMGGLDFAHAPLTYALLVMNIVVSGYAFFINSDLIERYSLNVGAILRGKEYYRFLSSGFFHADPFHIFVNLFTLHAFGPTIERVIGSGGFAIMYFGALIISGLITVYIKRDNLNYSAIGASGAITGVVFSFCLFFPTAKISFLFLPLGIPAIIFALAYTAYSMYAMDNQQIGGRIAHEAHLGGALGGIILTILIQPQALEHFLRQVGL